ncbi:cytochrome c-type biogenesis protein [Halopseudomonas salegens]|uniref:Cytochrome c-type biogenesis protein n=1 Tax=Halopseudomonas salegens TaxID=1434072 RepID=A0A1H2FXX4_9GAMM|nr:cytochrome c-type biogenesis protein [Halopseudomonas salegens]SDU12100.1 cytochrome c-type biogenesis protein CcmH [Halopseudomonas salegens]
MMRFLLVAVFTLLAWFAQAAVDTFEFDSEEQRQRYYQLGQELRCPMCQNQNIADSDAPIAADLRREVYRLLQEDKSDSEITDYMVQRYGDFVRYRPPLNAQTLVLWIGPGVLLLAGFAILGVMVRRRRKALAGEVHDLSDDDQQRLQSLLKKRASDD